MSDDTTFRGYPDTATSELHRALDLIASQAAELARITAERDALLGRLQPKRESECVTAEDWRLKALDLEANWSRCSQACAKLQGERDALRAALTRARADTQTLHMVQSINNQNQPAAWHDAVDAALEAIDASMRRPEGADMSESVETDRQREVIRSVNARCDHLGMRLGEVIRERDALAAEIDALRAAQDENRLLRLLVDLRCALGDDGKRMQDELVEHAKALRADADRLDSGRITLTRRDEFGEAYERLTTGVDLRAAIDAALASE